MRDSQPGRFLLHSPLSHFSSGGISQLSELLSAPHASVTSFLIEVTQPALSAFLITVISSLHDTIITAFPLLSISIEGALLLF